jgi:hypothetical protein
MRHKLLYLPCFVYAISFASILLLYQIGWSDLFPKLNGRLLIFLFATIILSLILSFTQKRYLQFGNNDADLKPVFVTRALYFIAIGNILDFLYESSIPIVKTMVNASYSYHDFNGIPTFHVILGTFNIFFSILMFNYYLTERSRKKLFQFIATLIPYILIMNRGAFMIVFSAMIFLFLMRLKSIKLRTILMPFIVFGIVLYFFGVVGNVRQEETKDDKEYLLKVAGATDDFLYSGVPSEFYWSYIYLISPMGNLQNLVDGKEGKFDVNNIGLFATTQLFPDFISKRLSALFGYGDILESNESAAYFVTPLLNAPTVFFPSYFLLGTIGLVVMYLAIMFSALVYPYFISRDSKYYATSIASLNSLILLSTFNNMWYAVGTILLWPIFFNFINRLKLK